MVIVKSFLLWLAICGVLGAGVVLVVGALLVRDRIAEALRRRAEARARAAFAAEIARIEAEVAAMLPGELVHLAYTIRRDAARDAARGGAPGGARTGGGA